MAKIVMLTPSLMLENNRKLNNVALDFALMHYDVDLIVINDQEYLPSDYRDEERILYIGKHEKRQGFVKGRNQLLEWFYESDYDWAIWLDANAKITSTTLNDFRTLIDAIRNDIVEVDVVLSTLGIYISENRIEARKADDHLENIKLTSVMKKECDWMHAMFMRNFNKVYGMKPFINETCDPKVGLSEDVYFVQLLKRLFQVRQCPTIIVTKPSNKASTWVADKANYGYPPIDWKGISRLVRMNKLEAPKQSMHKETYIIPRAEYMKDRVTIYKDRKKKVKGGLL